jgi:hypothetical protein
VSLSLVKEIVEQHDGRVSVVSVKGKGPHLLSGFRLQNQRLHEIKNPSGRRRGGSGFGVADLLRAEGHTLDVAREGGSGSVPTPLIISFCARNLATVSTIARVDRAYS